MSYGMIIYKSTGQILLNTTDSNFQGAVIIGESIITIPSGSSSSYTTTRSFPNNAGLTKYFAICSDSSGSLAPSTSWSYPGGVPTFTLTVGPNVTGGDTNWIFFAQ